MGRIQLRFVVCTLCIILQCNISLQAQIRAKNNCNTVEIRIPISSISNKNSPPQNRQYGSNYPYPYYTQLSQYYANICNSCKGFLCNNRCSNSNPIKLNSPSNTLSLSVPSNSNTGRLTFIIDSRSAAKTVPVATKPLLNNGENNIDVIVKVVPIDHKSTNGTAYTSAQSSAKHNEYGNQITALTTAQELDSNSAKDYEIEVYVKDVNTGTSPVKTSLQSKIIAENADGDVLVSKTNSNIIKTAILAADGDDTTVTGDTLPPIEPTPDTPVTPPAVDLQAPPVTPESDVVLSDAPGPNIPPRGSFPVGEPPVASPLPGPPPAAAPPVVSPPPAPTPVAAPPAVVPSPPGPTTVAITPVDAPQPASPVVSPPPAPTPVAAPPTVVPPPPGPTAVAITPVDAPQPASPPAEPVPIESDTAAIPPDNTPLPASPPAEPLPIESDPAAIPPVEDPLPPADDPPPPADAPPLDPIPATPADAPPAESIDAVTAASAATATAVTD